MRVSKKSYNQYNFNIETSGLNEDNLNMFFRLIYERQMIWKRRFIDCLPAPWTTDKIFAKFKFCNVYREHDRSCQWEIRNIIMDPNLDDIRNLVWKILVYRTFNNPETFARALEKWPNGIPDFDSYDENAFADHISFIREIGLNPFTNAYSITGNVSRGNTIDDQFCHTVIPTIHDNMDGIMNMIDNARMPEQIITFLMTLPSVSKFIAHEYYQDFTYIPIYSDRKLMKFDQNDYTNLGPGSSQGVRLLFPRLKTPEQIYSYDYLLNIAEEKLEEIGLEKGELMPYTQWNKETKQYDIISECNFTYNQIEGALCEFSKYMRIYNRTGRPRCSEFEAKTSTIIVSREENSQDEFLTEFEDLTGHKGARRNKTIDDFASNKVSNPRGPYKKHFADVDFAMTLNLNLNVLNLKTVLDELKDFLTK